jgi:hypothetical protein
MNEEDEICMDDEHFFVNYSGRIYCVCGFLHPPDGAKLAEAEYEATIYQHAEKHHMPRPGHPDGY